MTKTAIRSASYNQTLALAETFETLSHSQTEILNIVYRAAPLVSWTCPDTGAQKHWDLFDRTILRQLIFQIDVGQPEKPPIVSLTNAMLAADCDCTIRRIQQSLRKLESGGWLLRRYRADTNWRYARGMIEDPPGLDLRPLVQRLNELQILIDRDKVYRSEQKQAVLKPVSEIMIHLAVTYCRTIGVL